MGIREKLHLFKNKDNAEENSSKEAARKCVLKYRISSALEIQMISWL